MSNTYDIELKVNICTNGGLNKKEKRKEINHNRKQFKAWVTTQLNKFDDAENNMDEWCEFSDDCVPFNIKQHGIDYINGIRDDMGSRFDTNDMGSRDTNEVWSIDKGKWISID